MRKNAFRALPAALLLSLSSTAAAVTIEDIQNRAEQHVAAAVAARYPQGQAQIHALPLAPTVRDKACNELQLAAPQQRLYGRVSIHVRCNAPQTWALYAQVQVDLELPVVVAQRMISRGEALTRSAVAIEMRPAQQVRSNAVSVIDDALGKAASRSLRSGQVLSTNHLTVPDAVRKGERVAIVSNSGRVQINTYGIALENGKVGEQIEVQNERSKRVIHPWVTGSGTVSTRPRQVVATAGQ